MVGEHVGDVYFSIWSGPTPRKVIKYDFLPFSHRQTLYHRKVNFLVVNRQNSRGIGVFGGGESIASIIFSVWMGLGPKNFEFFRFFRYKNVAFIGKVNFWP